MPAYGIARCVIHDPTEYKRYADHVPGIIAKDGKSFIMSADKGISTGTFEAGTIEYCGATSSLDDNLAFCTTLEKVK